MTESAKKSDNLAKPAAHVAKPKDAVADRSLSAGGKSEVLDNLEADRSLSAGGKSEVLDNLELDARLLDTAASEGMSGGELNKLYEVLQAKDHLAIQRKTKKA